MKYHFKIHKEGKGFWAECIELSGCYTQGDSKQDLLENLSEALNLFLDEPHDSKQIFPLPNPRIKCSSSIVEITVDTHVSFSFLLRRTRLLNNLTQTEMKNLLNFKSVFSYQKLEKSRYANPTLKSILKIKEVLPEFPFKLLLA